jgi:hypothetical protein
MVEALPGFVRTGENHPGKILNMPEKNQYAMQKLSSERMLISQYEHVPFYVDLIVVPYRI